MNRSEKIDHVYKVIESCVSYDQCMNVMEWISKIGLPENDELILKAECVQKAVEFSE